MAGVKSQSAFPVGPPALTMAVFTQIIFAGCVTSSLNWNIELIPKMHHLLMLECLVKQSQ
jgi:hypothetical protein